MIDVHVWLYQKDGRTLASEKPIDGYDEVVFTLKEPDCESWNRMDAECLHEIKLSRTSINRYDMPKMRKWQIRHFLKQWSFDEPLTFKGELLDDESTERAMRLPSNILNIVLSHLQNDSMTDEEKNEVARQSALLFGNAGSVTNAHPMLSLYVLMSDMWQKFGLNYFDLQKLPISLKNGLKEIMQLENQVRASTMKSETNVDENILKRVGK